MSVTLQFSDKKLQLNCNLCQLFLMATFIILYPKGLNFSQFFIKFINISLFLPSLYYLFSQLNFNKIGHLFEVKMK